MGRLWRGLLEWLEGGDLVPLLVIVSAVHYAAVLQAHDWPVVGAVIGLLVDIGHFRSVLIATRYTGENRRERAIRWGVALVMTAVSLSYHWRFYEGQWDLAVPIPLLIAALAYFERKDAYKRRKPAEPSVEDAPEPVEDTREIAEDTDEGVEETYDAPPMPYRYCDLCAFAAQSPQAWAGHCRGAGHKRKVTQEEPSNADALD